MVRTGVRRWAFVTVLLYGVAILALYPPLAATAFYTAKKDFNVVSMMREIYTSPEYWIGMAALMLLEAVFLFAPISVARQRPIGRGRWWALAVTAALMLGVLAFGLVFAFYEAFKFAPDTDAPTTALVLGGIVWVGWAVIFGLYSRQKNQSRAVRKIVDRVMTGSIAELLIAVPCHIYVRGREECCAGFGTFAGLVAGFAVLLFAFGPGVFFLFVARARKLRMASAATETDDYQEFNERWRPVRHSGRALLWSLGVLAAYGAVIGVSVWLHLEANSIFRAARVSFLLLAVIACWYAWVAMQRRERGWRYAVFSALLLLECVVGGILWS